jgi:hypothetical protein
METGRSRKYVDAKAPDPVPGFIDATGVPGAIGVPGVVLISGPSPADRAEIDR